MQLLLLVFALIASVTHATVRHVPADHATIQSAILASVNGDTVLVDEGTYVENVDFRGRSIVVASHFLIDDDVEHIPLTIIDGSQPEHADSGSVVRIISGEDSTTAIIGFTITGGTGTKFRDQSDQAFYVEGGGIIIENSDPLIAFNYIVENEATRQPAGVQSAGGGGIRYGYCSPRIYNNLVLYNSGKYGGGVVSFFADGDLRNNVIANNDGGQAYGGGGLWIGGTGHSTTLINNTIVGNESILTGGGIRLFAGVLNGHGNIVWGNQANTGSDQIGGAAQNIHLDYCCVEQTLQGAGNIFEYPEFQPRNLLLASTSPCINAGNPDAEWNDIDGSRNDMGCYGGPGAATFPTFGLPVISVTPTSYYIHIFDGEALFMVTDSGAVDLELTCELAHGDRFFIASAPPRVAPFNTDQVIVDYHYEDPWEFNFDTLLVTHNDPNVTSPLRIPITFDPGDDATSFPDPFDFALHPAFPNPFNPTTTISFALPAEQLVNLNITDIQGRKVAQLLNSRLAAGEHSVEWNASPFSSGTYIATVHAGKWQDQTKLLLVK